MQKEESASDPGHVSTVPKLQLLESNTESKYCRQVKQNTLSWYKVILFVQKILMSNKV